VERRPLAANRHQGRRARRAFAAHRRAPRLRHRQESGHLVSERMVRELFRRDEQELPALRAPRADGEGVIWKSFRISDESVFLLGI
jgi:hypothetical protein